MGRRPFTKSLTLLGDAYLRSEPTRADAHGLCEVLQQNAASVNLHLAAQLTQQRPCCRARLFIR
jgi:hypothetical protein